MYCKLTTYTVTDIHGEDSANSRYMVDLQSITPPHLLNNKIANTAFVLEQQQLPEPFVVSVLFI